MKNLNPTQSNLDKLKNDELYYGEFGQQWLSNSDVYSLLKDPKSFRQPKDQTKAMLEGRYFHTALLEPNKLSQYKVVDFTSRNTKGYKDLLEKEGKMMLLQKEKENLNKMIEVINNNEEMSTQINNLSNQYETPMIKNIMGVGWKGKADIVCEDKLIDIKTSSSISDFRYSARKYNYDSQAYIYQELFNKPLEFFVIDKNTFQLGVFVPGDEFIIRGKEKVEQALFMYNTFFSKDSREDINQFIHHEML
tara:strand:+ start:886 stop:1632 length:747 start_codon:yes stop_codon:yes gene_type:complete